ncbi:MarR family transcriptional regulator [Rhodococcus sp. TAF43]|uniref:MarR family winged helix-turn-helix transcriptional regulator n=1 Tax=unclassified Rhodococcus (in: high G+C Gram-positive bacteria) TaxID=192944 RepID=UPI000E0A0965|nr:MULTISPECIES: MarR family transcriptional regulator [unclassified Rhodococcus (in: high G+C Gram-positive bacteria)]QKT09569.1 MarR family transcriptional regulator [Rhodococcus sp. W8901]RDI12054.1 MarR family transcriptional regulator [Rhodococcus sp. AG1013]
MDSTDSPERDFIDKVRQEWALSYPEVDTSPIEVIGRITRISSQALHRLERALGDSGVSRAEFEVLCALARSDRPLRASEVTAVTMVSGAATTKHADRLVKMGLLERRRFERDGRVVLLAVTDAGRALVDAEFPERVDRDRRLLDGLDEDDRAQLARLLRRIAYNSDAADRP